MLVEIGEDQGTARARRSPGIRRTRPSRCSGTCRDTSGLRWRAGDVRMKARAAFFWALCLGFLSWRIRERLPARPMVRVKRFDAKTIKDAKSAEAWQASSRELLFDLLKMTDLVKADAPGKDGRPGIPLDVKVTGETNCGRSRSARSR